MDNFLMSMIAQRMREMGFDEYSFEPYRALDLTASKLQINANNEYYYLVAKTVVATLEITSDTNVFTTQEAAQYANFNYFGMQEFTGTIDILRGAGIGIDVEFMRVIPRVPRTDKEKVVIDQMLFGVKDEN